MNDFLKGLFGYDPATKRYSTTESMATILILLVVIATGYELITGRLFQHYNDLLMYAIGGASGNKVAKGIVTTVQKFAHSESGESDA